jgi:integrase
MAGSGKLTAKWCDAVKKVGRYGDGEGLWLQVAKVGENVTRSWLFRFQRNGHARSMGLGKFPRPVSLAMAREKAREAAVLLANGVDPIQQKHETRAADKIAAASAITFKVCAERYMEAHTAAWKNQTHRMQWRSSLENYVYPTIGSLPVAAVDTSLVLQILEPIWERKNETACRVRLRVEKILDWAKVRGFRSGDNAAQWKGHLDKLLPKPSRIRRVRHHAALPYTEIAAFMKALQQHKGIAAGALEFLTLCSSRSGEVTGARWSEIDLKAKVWIIPPERMLKTGREHRVPLADRAVQILESLPHDGDLVFGGDKSLDHSMWKLIRNLRPGMTVHGLRSTFRDWCSERATNYGREIAEAALSHRLGDAAEQAYARSDFFEKRRRLMAEWARYCSRPAPAPSAVADLAKARQKRGKH